MKRISIVYTENNGKSILHALRIILEYTDMKIEEAAILLTHFNKKNDIFCDVPTGKINIILYHLNSLGFIFKVLEQ